MIDSAKKAQASKVRYSQQALIYLQLIEDIDIEEFEKWYMENIVIGGGDIMAYAKKLKNIK